MRTAVDRRQTSRQSRWVGRLVLAILGAVLFFVGRLSGARVTPAEPHAPVPQMAGAVESESAPVHLPTSVPRLRSLPPSKTDENCPGPSEQARRDTATAMMDGLLRRIEGLEHFPGMDNPERRASTARDYARGLADALRAGRSDLYEAMSEDLSDRLCSGPMADDKIILMSYLAMELPEMVGSRGLDCYFGRAKGKENAALWNMIDAWRTSGSEKPKALSLLEATSTDERTLRRLASPEEAAAARAAAARSSAPAVAPSPPPTGTSRPGSN